MALTSAHQRSALRLRSARVRLSDALRAMDYELALRCQIGIDDVQREANVFEPRRYGHVFLLQRNERLAARDY
jgi:hypothetical protein